MEAHLDHLLHFCLCRARAQRPHYRAQLARRNFVVIVLIEQIEGLLPLDSPCVSHDLGINADV